MRGLTIIKRQNGHKGQFEKTLCDKPHKACLYVSNMGALSQMSDLIIGVDHTNKNYINIL